VCLESPEGSHASVLTCAQGDDWPVGMTVHLHLCCAIFHCDCSHRQKKICLRPLLLGSQFWHEQKTFFFDLPWWPCIMMGLGVANFRPCNWAVALTSRRRTSFSHQVCTSSLAACWCPWFSMMMKTRLICCSHSRTF